jgi:hypothetical protein
VRISPNSLQSTCCAARPSAPWRYGFRRLPWLTEPTRALAPIASAPHLPVRDGTNPLAAAELPTVKHAGTISCTGLVATTLRPPSSCSAAGVDREAGILAQLRADRERRLRSKQTLRLAAVLGRSDRAECVVTEALKIELAAGRSESAVWKEIGIDDYGLARTHPSAERHPRRSVERATQSHDCRGSSPLTRRGDAARSSTRRAGLLEGNAAKAAATEK